MKNFELFYKFLKEDKILKQFISYLEKNMY